MNGRVACKEIKCLVYGLFILFPLTAPAQINLYTVQEFNFGTFTHGGAGGTVVLSPEGIRSATGDIILLNNGTAETVAIFDIEAPAGSTISITNGPDATLTGSNGGSMTLKLGQTDLQFPLNTTAVPPYRTRFHLGGTLEVGDLQTSPAGTYSGTFSITIHQE